MSTPNVSTQELTAIHAQIQKICNHFRLLRSEAEGILEKSEMPDSKLQLGDVLASTEEATMTIIETVGTINAMVEDSAMPADKKSEVAAHVSRIFEACSFQDITGQRIKKVMQRLELMEEDLMRLSSVAQKQSESLAAGDDGMPSAQVVSLKNGPQLSAQAPSQAAIDKMFGGE